MKINYDSITKDNPAWKVGDVIGSDDNSLYLVAKVADLNNEVSGYYFYTLVNLRDGLSSESYETIAELQHYTCGAGDRILTGTFKYVDDDK
jgi:hypothetical protein